MVQHPVFRSFYKDTNEDEGEDDAEDDDFSPIPHFDTVSTEYRDRPDIEFKGTKSALFSQPDSTHQPSFSFSTQPTFKQRTSSSQTGWEHEEIRNYWKHEVHNYQQQGGDKPLKILQPQNLPKLTDPKFNTKILKHFRKFEIGHVPKTLKAICFPKTYQLQAPQKFVEAYMSPQTQYKNLLVFHRIGAGKTCTAIRVGEKWKVKKRRIIVVLPAALKENFRNELRSECANNEYLTAREREALKTLNPKDPEYKEIIHASDKRIDKYYHIYSYNKFVALYEQKEINLRNAVLIVDEVQNMVSEEGRFYNVLYQAIHEAPSDLRVLLLSATPMFDKPIEIALTLNLLRLPKPLPTGSEFEHEFIEKIELPNGTVKRLAKNLDVFKERIKGYVSYFRGAPPIAFPRMNYREVRCPMGQFQLESYLTVKSLDEAEEHSRATSRKKVVDDIEELPSNFYLGTRIISNIAFPNNKISEHGWDSLDQATVDDLENYSAKIAAILRRIKRTKGPVFCFSNFKEYGGIRSLARILELSGYQDYAKAGPGKKRFAIWSGDVPGKLREEIRTVFNQSSNVRGKEIKIILGSPSIKEGVSFRNVRQVHVMEPYWNRSRIEQVIGRASRFCSHKDLSEDEMEVDVYVYVVTHPDIPETVDQYILALSKEKDALIKQFEIALKEAAVDCLLNRLMNQFEDVSLECML
jgi:superfamily II DNA or RNA helicase